jgi:hypothetical protein
MLVAWENAMLQRVQPVPHQRSIRLLIHHWKRDFLLVTTTPVRLALFTRENEGG